jgi:hypothetical protein
MAKRYQRAIRSRKSKEGQTTQWPKDTKGQSEAVNQRYLLAIVLSVLPLIYGFWLPFGIFWPLCCLFSFDHCVVCCCKSKEGQTTQWPKDNKGQSEAVNQRRTDNTMAKRYQRAIRSRKSKEGQTYLLAIVLSVLPLIYGF